MDLETCSKELEEARDQLLRVRADFENAKKRWLREQAHIQEFANGNLLHQLLEIYDDFERALAAESGHPEVLEGGPEDVRPSTGSGRTDASFRVGVKMIGKRMEEFLRSYGVAPIEAVGQPFEPDRHEAVAHEETDQAPESTVIAELRKGYMMNGRVLRHSVVKVAVKPKGSDPVGSEESPQQGV